MSKNTHAGAKEDVSQNKKIKSTESSSTKELHHSDPPSISPSAVITAAAEAAAAEATSSPFGGRYYNGGGQKIGRIWKMGDLHLSTGYHSGEPMLKISKGNIWKSGYQTVFLSAAEYFELRVLLSKMVTKVGIATGPFKLGMNNTAASVEIDSKNRMVTINASYMREKAVMNLSVEEFAAFDKALNSFWYPMLQYTNNAESAMVIHYIFQLASVLIVSSMIKQFDNADDFPANTSGDIYKKAFDNAYTEMVNFAMSTVVLDKVEEKYLQASVKLDLFTLYHQCMAQIEIVKDYVEAEYFKPTN